MMVEYSEGGLWPNNGNDPEITLHWQPFYEEDEGPTAMWLVYQPSKTLIGLGVMIVNGYSYIVDAKINRGHYGR